MTWTTGFVVAATLAEAALAQESMFPSEVAATVGSTSHQIRGKGDFDGDGDIDIQSEDHSTFVPSVHDGPSVFTPGAPLSRSPVGGVIGGAPAIG